MGAVAKTKAAPLLWNAVCTTLLPHPLINVLWNNYLQAQKWEGLEQPSASTTTAIAYRSDSLYQS